MDAQTERSTPSIPMTCGCCKTQVDWIAEIDDVGLLCFYCLWIKTGVVPLP